MPQGTGNLIKEAYSHVENLGQAAEFSSPDELESILYDRAKLAIYACYLLSSEHFGTSKQSELSRAFPKKDLSWHHRIIKEPYSRFVHLPNRSTNALKSLTTVFPRARGETNQMKIKRGIVGPAKLSVKTIRKDQKSNYPTLLPLSGQSRGAVIIQPLATVSHDLTTYSTGNSRTPYHATIYHAAVQYVKPSLFNPSLELAYIPTRAWSEQSASLLDIKSTEMQLSRILAHALIANAMHNPYDGSAFSSND